MKGDGVKIAKLNVLKLQNLRENVALVSATSDGQLAYEGAWDGNPAVRVGRFTHTLIYALGSSVRWKQGAWVVHPGSLIEDLKALHRLRKDWRDKPFEPTQPIAPNDIHAIVRKPGTPLVPIQVLTDPSVAMTAFDLCIFAGSGRAPPEVARRDARDPAEWTVWIPASQYPHFAVAEEGADFHEALFVPAGPVLDQRIPVP